MDINLNSIDNSDADKRVKEAYRLLKKYADQTVRKEWLKKRRDCWDAVYEDEEHTTMWTDKQRKDMEDKGMIPLVINDLYKGVQGSSAVITDQKPGVTFLPVGSGDLYVAELMRRAFDQAWASNYGSSEAFEFVKEAKVGGLSCFDVRHDPAKGIYGKLVIGNYDPENVFFDMENSRKADLSDTDIIKARFVTKAYAKETYDVTDEDLAFRVAQENQEAGKLEDTATGIDNYTRDTKDGPPDDSEPQEKTDVLEIEAHLLKRERQIWLMTPDGRGGWSRQIFKKDQKEEAEAARGENGVIWMRTIEKRVLRIIIGKKLVPQMVDGQEAEESENPIGIDADGDPVVPIICLMHDRTRKGKPVSPTVFAKESCRERNKRRSQAIYVVTKNIDAPFFTYGETVKWSTDKVHGDTMLVDPKSPGPPGRLTPGTVSVEALKLEQIAKQDVDEMYDMQDVMKGKLPAGDPSGRLVLALQDMAGMMSKPFTRALESALVRLGKVSMAIILRTWPRETWERLIEKDEWGEWKPEGDKKKADPLQDMMQGGQQSEPGEKEEILKKWILALAAIKPFKDPSEAVMMIKENTGIDDRTAWLIISTLDQKKLTKGNGVSLLDVDVRVSAGSTMPTNRMARAAEARENVKMGIYDAEAALDYIDDPKKDQIAARLKQKEAAMMAAGMAKGQ